MTLLARLRSFARALFLRRRLEREMRDEWQFHLAARVEGLVERGVARADAERQARLEFGDLLRWTEEGREARGLRWIQDLDADVRYALRQMRRAPAFTAAAVATLALAVGANTAIFSIVNGLLLRPLPVAEPHRLVTVSAGAEARYPWTFAIWDQIRQRAGAFAGALAWAPQRLTLAHGGDTSAVDALLVSGDFFATLGIQPAAGRLLTSGDDARGVPAGAVAVISHGLWQRRFGGSATVVGTPIAIEGVPFTVVGVTPPQFVGVEVGRMFDIAVPFGAEPLMRGQETLLDKRHAYWITVMLRLRPEQSIEAATALLRAAQPAIREAAPPHPATPAVLNEFLADPFTLVPAAGGTSDLRRRFERPLLAILGIVAVVLVIGCANLANLLLARASARSHEVGVRFALGASRGRVVRQLLVESFVLAAVGAAAALLLASWGSRLLVAQLSTSASRIELDLSIDWRVLAFTTVLTMATALVFGAAPALRATRVQPVDALKLLEPAWARRRSRAAAGSSGLVIAQVTLSFVLVVCAGLLVGTFTRLSGMPRGFDSEHVLVAAVDTSRARTSAERRIDLCRQLVEAVAAVPGVERAAGSTITPVSGINYRFPVDAGAASALPMRDRFVRANVVTPGWFSAYGTGIKSGRDFDARDSASAEPVIIINESFARRFFPRVDPIGQRITRLPPPGSDDPRLPRIVIGVVGDAIYRSVRDGVEPLVYLPMAQEASIGRFFSISLRASAGRPDVLTRSVAEAITAVDPGLTVGLRTLEEQVTASFAQERLVALVSGFFGVVALALAAVGLYGLTAYDVSRRRVEIGVRLALGARRSHIAALVLVRTIGLTACGIVCGLAGAAAASRYLEGMLFGLPPRDPATFIVASATLMTVAAVAAGVPARRATALDPALTLRCE